MTITSYSLNFEDVILWRALKHIKQGFYIDIGAQDPVVDSVSLAFYEHGWRGVHVEPTEAYAAKLREKRPDEEVVQVAIGNGSNSLLFYEIAETGLSTGTKELADKHASAGFDVREITVPLLSLSELLERHRDRDIHWLKIDVEGMERTVVESWGTCDIRPWIVVVESTVPLSTTHSHIEWENELEDRGYDFVYFDGLNRFYVSREHGELKENFGPGPNYFDDFVLSGNSSFCRAIVAESFKQLEEERNERAMLEERLQSDHVKTDKLLSELEEMRGSMAAQERKFQAELDNSAALLKKLQDTETARATTLKQLQDTEADRATTLKQLNDARAATAALEGQLSAIYRSTSWRITAPLRLLKPGAVFTATRRNGLRQTAVAMARTVARQLRKMPYLRRLALRILPDRIIRSLSKLANPDPRTSSEAAPTYREQLDTDPHFDPQQLLTILSQSEPADAISTARFKLSGILINWQTNESKH